MIIFIIVFSHVIHGREWYSLDLCIAACSQRKRRKITNEIDDEFLKAAAYCDKVLPYLVDIRYHCDKLELVVDDNLWPLAKYRELLFCR